MAPATARAALESLLRTRKLDTTLTTALPLAPSRGSERLAPSGVAALDEALGGGFARGHLSEVIGSGSTGRTALIHAALATATRNGELVAIVDTLDRFDPASAAASGVHLDRVLWVRGNESGDRTPVARGTASTSLSRSIKALNLVLSAGGFGVVVLDVAEVPARALGALPFTTWLRLQRVIAGSDTACLIVSSSPLTRSSAGASIRLEPRSVASGQVPPVSFHDRVLANRRPFVDRSAANERVSEFHLWTGATPARRFRGLAVRAHVQSGLRTAACALDLVR
jgi:recA bacterial DNA recombination protein